MNKTLFVCYAHGCRGEGLTVRISQHDFFCGLDAKNINGRTVIMNEYFDKRFLMHRTRIDFSKMHLPTDKNIVVPSHYFFDTLGDIYPNAKFISIDVPKDLGEFKQSLYDRYFEYRTNNFLELMGECKDKFWSYNRQADNNDFEEFVCEVLRIKNRTFGDILCLARGMTPTVTNKQSLLNDMCPDPLNNKIIKNSLVIPYEDIKTINIEDIITYVKK
jgi:hypothetical protein